MSATAHHCFTPGCRAAVTHRCEGPSNPANVPHIYLCAKCAADHAAELVAADEPSHAIVLLSAVEPSHV